MYDVYPDNDIVFNGWVTDNIVYDYLYDCNLFTHNLKLKLQLVWGCLIILHETKLLEQMLKLNVQRDNKIFL